MKVTTELETDHFIKIIFKLILSNYTAYNHLENILTNELLVGCVSHK